MALYVIDLRDEVAQRVTHKYDVDLRRFAFIEANNLPEALDKIRCKFCGALTVQEFCDQCRETIDWQKELLR